MKSFLKKYYPEVIVILLILIISYVHYATDSIESPIHSFIRLLFIIPIIIGSFRFGFKGAIITSIFISLIYSPHILLSLKIDEKTISEFVDILLFFIVSIVTGILAEKQNMRQKDLKVEVKKHAILERYTNSIIESIKTGVVVVNKDMLITIINQGAKDILGASEHCIGQNFSEAFVCCENIKYQISEVLQSNHPNENISVNLTSVIKDLSIKISVYPLTLDSINKGLVIIIEDVTEMKRLQQQVQRNDRLTALGELSSGLAHEIRNPLAIIKAIEQTIKKELKDHEEIVKELDIIDEEVERANKIVIGLMEFAKPSRNMFALGSVNDVLDDVLTIVNKYAVLRNIAIDLKKGDIFIAKIDKEQLKQAFINIIFNAIEAMPNGGTIRITTQNDEEEHIKIVFADSGIGIEPSSLDRIFNPFFTTKDEGTGLGLAIVHRIIEEHGGVISVASTIEVGTTFEILIPMEKEESQTSEENTNS